MMTIEQRTRRLELKAKSNDPGQFMSQAELKELARLDEMFCTHEKQEAAIQAATARGAAGVSGPSKE